MNRADGHGAAALDGERQEVSRALVLAGFGLFALVWWLPLDGLALMDGLDPERVRLGLGIFVCIAFLWMSEALPLAVTALLVPLLAVVTGARPVQATLAPFADPLIVVFFGGFALASAMAARGLDRWVAHGLVRLGRGRFLRVSMLVFCATAFLSMWMSNTATVAMMLPLAVGILARIDGDAGDARHNRLFLLLGLAYAASIGGLGTVIGSPPNLIAASALDLSFAGWMRIGLPVVILGVPLMAAVLRWQWRPDPQLRIETRSEEFVFDFHRMAMLGVFVFAAACWIFGKQLGGLLGVDGSMDAVVALAVVFLLLVLGVVDWRRILLGTDWSVLLLFGGGLALSGVLRETGASDFMARGLTMLVTGWPQALVVVAVVTFVIFLTELASNTAVAALFVPVFHALATQLGTRPEQLVLPLALAASCAFMMPVATPPNALVFATGQVRQREMMRTGLKLNLVFVLFLAALSLLLF